MMCLWEKVRYFPEHLPYFYHRVGLTRNSAHHRGRSPSFDGTRGAEAGLLRHGVYHYGGTCNRKITVGIMILSLAEHLTHSMLSEYLFDNISSCSDDVYLQFRRLTC